MKIINFPLIASILLVPLLGACDPSSNNNSSSEVVLPSPPSTPENNNNNNDSVSENNNDNLIALSQTCTNNDIGYQVNYPPDWQTNPGEVLASCQVFDPESATVPEYTESTEKAVYLRFEENVPFDLAAKENMGERHLSRQDLTIQGNQAVAVESESTGKAMLPEGMRTYSYIVDLGDRTMIATTYDIPGNDYQRNKQILDRMMETIQFKGQLAQQQ